MKSRPVQIRKLPHTDCTQCPIRNMALFQGVPLDRLVWTQKYRDQQFIVPNKTVLYSEGSKPSYVYTLFDGWMALYQSSKSGKRQILRFALPGDFLGFQANANGVISHSVSALTDSTVCGFPRAILQEMFEEQPMLALKLATMESRDMSLCQHHQAFSSRKDAHESIAFLLLELFHRSRIQMSKNYDAEKNMVVFPLTQEDVGDAVGLTNVHVNRVLQQFNKNGLINCHHKKLQILDEDKLAEIGGFDESMVSDGDYLLMMPENTT